MPQCSCPAAEKAGKNIALQCRQDARELALPPVPTTLSPDPSEDVDTERSLAVMNWKTFLRFGGISKGGLLWMKPVSCISTLIIIEVRAVVLSWSCIWGIFRQRSSFEVFPCGFLAKAGEICFSAALLIQSNRNGLQSIRYPTPDTRQHPEGGARYILKASSRTREENFTVPIASSGRWQTFFCVRQRTSICPKNKWEDKFFSEWKMILE